MTSAPAPALPGISSDLQARLDTGLTAVEDLLRARVDHDDPFIAAANTHLIAGGKRFRPMLTMLAAELGSGINDRVVAAATAVELTHIASLYHDDVMDRAGVRHGLPTANATYGNSTAILIGDLLFGTASDIVSDLGPEAVKIQSQAFVRLCAGQIRDDQPCPPGQDPHAYYLQVLADKTGVLIATSARYGALLSGCDRPTIATLVDYGERLGVAFQLADDLIDITSEIDVLGKAPGTDIREGKRTLPIIYALASQDPADVPLQELLRLAEPTEEQVLEALTLLRRHPAMDRARADTEAVAVGAMECLSTLPDGEIVAALRHLADRVVRRDG